MYKSKMIFPSQKRW